MISIIIYDVRILIKTITEKLIIFQINWFFAYFEKKTDKYPIKKKNEKKAKETPIPNINFSLKKKLF